MLGVVGTLCFAYLWRGGMGIGIGIGWVEI